MDCIGAWTCVRVLSPAESPHPNPARQRSRQAVEQRRGLPQIGRVKALREPTIEGGQQLSGLVALALALPQAAQAQCGAQLQRLGLLAVGHVESPVQPGFCLVDPGAREEE